MDRISLAISFSNVQYGIGIPAVYAGIAVKTEDKAKLEDLTESVVSDAEEQMKLNPFNLEPLERVYNEYQRVIASTYLKWCEPNEKSFKADPFGHILRNEFNVLESFVSGDILLQSSELQECVVKLPIYGNGIEMKIGDPSQYQLPLLGVPIRYQGTSNPEGLMNLTRILSKLKFAEVRRTKPQFINTQLRKTRELFAQIVYLASNSPPIEGYSGYSVGPPKLLLKRGGNLEAITIEVGSEISIFPIARYCVGPFASVGESESACLRASEKLPFGSFLGNSPKEKCSACEGDSGATEFIYRHSPVPDSYEGMEDWFVKSVILNDYAIYFTIFGSKLKVGRALFSKVVGRLVAQSAADAFVIYPVQTYKVADYLETRLVKFLKKAKSRIGVSTVTERITAEERLEQVLSRQPTAELDRGRSQIYRNVIRALERAEEPELRSLLYLEHREISLTDNWTVDGVDASDLSKGEFRWVKGKVKGLAGSLVFMDSEVINLDSLAGYVVKLQ